MSAPAFNPQTEQLEFIAGDQPAVVQQGRAADPMGTGLVGNHSTVRLDKSALGHPLVRYKDHVLECDIYPLLGAAWDGASAGALEVILICPNCRHQLRVTSDKKAIEFAPGMPELDDAGQPIVRGTLSVEPFQCTWELDTTRDVKATVQSHGDNICRWRVGIDKNVARDA